VRWFYAQYAVRRPCVTYLLHKSLSKTTKNASRVVVKTVALKDSREEVDVGVALLKLVQLPSIIKSKGPHCIS